MKTFLRILVVLLLMVLSIVMSHADEPLTAAEREKIQKQRDDLVVQLYNKLTQTTLELQSAQALHKLDVGEQAKLQETTNGMANTIQAQATKITALQKSVKLWKRIVAIEAGIAAVFLFLWLKVPELSPPWGLVATVLAGPLAFGLCMLL